MATTRRASIAMALLLFAWAATPVGADADTVSAASGSLGVVSGVGALAARVVNRLSESGALLIWGTGLAVASLALSRRHRSNK